MKTYRVILLGRPKSLPDGLSIIIIIFHFTCPTTILHKVLLAEMFSSLQCDQASSQLSAEQVEVEWKVRSIPHTVHP